MHFTIIFYSCKLIKNQKYADVDFFLVNYFRQDYEKKKNNRVKAGISSQLPINLRLFED